MGNSLLDILVLGRKAGKNAAAKAKEIDNSDAKLNLSHTDNYVKELKENGIEEARTSPILVPDYTNKNNNVS